MNAGRGWIAAALVAVVAVVGALVWRAASDAPAAKPAPIAMSPTADATTAVVAAASEVAMTSIDAPSPHGSDEVEVCGLGWVKAQADGTVDEQALRSAPAFVAARLRIVDTLRADSDPLARAAGLWLGLLGEASDEQRRLVAIGAPTCQETNCAAFDAAVHAVADIRERLAQQALSTQDPRVYALAFRSCRYGAGVGTCAMLGAAQWARLDEGNAAPWLFVLNEAASRKDDAGRDEALFRIASATRYDDRFLAISGLVATRARPGSADLAAAFALSVEAIGIETAEQHPPLQPLLTMCRGNDLNDVNRRQVCESIATLLVERSDTLLMARIGIGMGRRLGWPADRIDALRGEQAAFMDHLGSSDLDAMVSGCGGMQRALDRIGRQGTLGEIGGMREWIASTGRLEESFAREERDRRVRAAEDGARLVADAASAASAPPAAVASAPIAARVDDASSAPR